MDQPRASSTIAFAGLPWVSRSLHSPPPLCRHESVSADAVVFEPTLKTPSILTSTLLTKAKTLDQQFSSETPLELFSI